MTRAPTTDRRRVLGYAGAAAAVLTAGCSGTDGEGGNGTTTGGSSGVAESFTLGGRASGWKGMAPERIAEEPNPTLSFTPGERYEVTWENLDGAEHELVVEDANGEEIVATESASETGATRTVTFEATEAMAGYYCEYHPQSMRGQVDTAGDS